MCVMFMLLSACGPVPATDPAYQSVANNVSYSSVEALEYRSPDATIPYGDDPLQFAQLWLPEAVSTRAPHRLLILIHGGCWLNTYDISHTYALSTALAQAGYAVWSLEYRRTGDTGGGWPGSFDDILAGIHAAEGLHEQGIDARHPVIAGHSAGGHLALLAGQHVPHAAAVIGLAAITDIVDYARGDNSCQTEVPRFMGAELQGNEQRYAAANPASGALHSRTILLHGTADAIVPMSQADLPGSTPIRVMDGGHFDWVHPGTQSFRKFLVLLQEIST
jgi:acetyl esterase/lipase